MDDIEKGIESLRVKTETQRWNTEKKEKYRAGSAKVLYLIMICIGPLDRAFIKPLKDTKAKWDALYTKYSVIKPQEKREDLQKITNFTLPDGKLIEDAWIELMELGGRVVTANPLLASAYTEDTLFEFFLQGLPEEGYSVTRAALDAQDTLDTTEKLLILQKRESQLKDTSKALLAKNNRKYRYRDQESSGTESDYTPKKGSKRRITCYLCGEKQHMAQDCDLRDEILKFVQKLKVKSHTNKHKSHRKQKDSLKPKKKSSKFQKGHVANDTLESKSTSDGDDESSATELDSTEPESEGETETAAISKEAISKIQPSQWASDTGASSHMTDQTQLFRGPLIPIHRRTIKVGGGKLYSECKGTVEMRVDSGRSVLLSDVLYVPSLGVNLMSSRKICSQEGIFGSFDDKKMYFKKDNKTLIRADISGGIYMVSWIRKGLDEKAFSAQREIDQALLPPTPKTLLLEPIAKQEVIEPRCIHQAFEAESDSSSSSSDNRPKPKKESEREIRERYELMHRRFGHCGPEKLRKLHKVSNVRKVRIPRHAWRSPCEVCKLAKLRNQISKQLSPWKEQILELVSVDACGPLPKTLRGNSYFGMLVENATRKEWVIPAKSRDELVLKLRQWKIRVERETQMRLIAVRVDNAAELKSLLEDWVKTEGVVHQPTAAHQHNQNGLGEKAIQTSEGDMRATLIDAKLPIEFWDEAVEARTYIRNRLPGGVGLSTPDYTFSPEEAYTGVKNQQADHIRAFGTKCYAYVDPKSLPKGSRTDKLMPRGRVCVFMGYSETTAKQFKVYAPDLGYTTRSAVVDWDEGIQGGTIDLKIRGPNPQGTPNELPLRNPAGRPKRLVEEEEPIPTVSLPPQEKLNNFDIVIPAPAPKPRQRNPEPAVPPKDSPAQGIPGTTPMPDAGLDTTPIETDTANAYTPTPNKPQDRYDLRKRKPDPNDKLEERQAKIIKAMLAIAQNMDIGLEEAALLGTVGVEIIPIPKSYDEAISHPQYGSQWQAAIQQEIASLEANSTWEETTRPEGANLVSTKWVFAVKLSVDGLVERFKARLVARGFSQIWGEDYDETFAPTVRMDTLRAFMAIVAAKNLECRQFDIKNAFTESKLQETIYLSPPKGVVVRPGYVLRVKRSLYGLKQSARDWNLLAREFLLEIGFTQSLADPCLYTHTKRGIILLLYVDDIAAAAKKTSNIDWFYSKLSSRFNAKDLGGISKILGIRVTRNRKTRELFIDQEHYLRTVLDRFRFKEPPHKTKWIPLNGYDKIRPVSEQDMAIDETEYQQAIGSVMYGMVLTRPDIAFTTGRLSQYLKGPVQHHGDGLKELLRYIGCTIDQKIRYGPTKQSNLVVYTGDLPDENLTVYSDADWAGDKSDRKSTSGCVAMLYGGPISWASRKQKSVATSSTESEYIAMSLCAKQAVWLGQVIRDMGYPEYIGRSPTNVQIKGDNQGALALVKNPHLHERSKHIDIQYHHIRDLEERKKITVSYVPTTDMIADGMTKPLDRIAFTRFKELMGLTVSRSRSK